MNFGQKITLYLFITIVWVSVASAQPVHMPDPNLRAAVREALDIADRPEVQLDMSILRRHLTSLGANDRGISDLTGLEHATSLTSLKLQNNDISDLRPLTTLVNLTFIRLHGNQINDVGPLANLTKLTTLLLDSNNIADLRPLANLTQLTTLGLGDNNITDVSPLANLTQLPILYLKNNNITDISPLASLVNLERLELQNNRITDITPLENLKKLERLDTQNNPIFAPDSPVVNIPDPNLRAAIRKTLKLPDGITLNRAFMRQLTALNAGDRGISDITGLEFATSLTFLLLHNNDISNLRPLTNLVNLTLLRLHGNQINDITPLANLTELTILLLSANNITDISPLANLTQLTTLVLDKNNITDISPLANLINLERLELQFNQIADHSPVHNLSLAHFLYDETCDMPPFPLLPRLQNRTYPSIFAPWGVSVNQPHLSHRERVAQYDLHFSSFPFVQTYYNAGTHWEVRGVRERSIRIHSELTALNPNMVFLARVKMRNGPPGHFPADSPYWVRDSQGNIVEYPNGIRLINFTHPDVQDMIVQQAIAVSKCGLYDGIMFDWWADHAPVLADHQSGPEGYVGNEAEQRARDNILRRIRAATRPDYLIMVNTNDRMIPRTGPFINGGFMESTLPHAHTGDDLEARLNRVETALTWLEANMRQPRINGLAGGTNINLAPDDPYNLRWIRVVTTLSLTHSDGYIAYNIGSNEGMGYWYNFWDVDLGRPVGPKSQLYDEDIPGLYIREFTNGWAVYNHSGEAQVITLSEDVQGVASGRVGAEHTLPNLDGEMYLRMKPENPADINGDGVVNILDLVGVAQAISTGVGEGDVNGDGVVNVFDLVFVAGAIGGGVAAPSAFSLDLSIISAADVERWLTGTQGLGVGDADFQRGIRFLEGLFAALAPKETTLLPNYPNPFNPETWIPYRLARETEVVITIYDTKGTPVRRLTLGNQAPGHYAERGKAAYWDGRNEDGEAVSSGIYVYHFQAGDYAASRRMVIVK